MVTRLYTKRRLEMKIFTLWVKSSFLSLIRDERKTLEIRLAILDFPSVRVGDIFHINRKFTRRIIAIRQYSDFQSLVDREDLGHIMPGWTREKILSGLRELYGQGERNGVLVFELAD